MYKFVDTNQATHSTPLPSEALNFNGQFLEKSSWLSNIISFRTRISSKRN